MGAWRCLPPRTTIFKIPLQILPLSVLPLTWPLVSDTLDRCGIRRTIFKVPVSAPEREVFDPGQGQVELVVCPGEVWTIEVSLTYDQGRKFSPEQLQYYLEEWKTGTPHPGRPAPKSRSFKGPQIASTSWGTSETNLLRIFQEMEQWVGAKLPRRGGCPYMGHPSTIPRSWS